MTEGPLNVLRVTPRFDWNRVEGAPGVLAGASIGGLAVQVGRLTAGVAALGVRQTVLAPRPPGAPRAGVTAEGAAVTACGRAGVPGVHRAALAWLVGLVPELARARLRRPDAVHVHASGLAEPLLAALAARLLVGRPVVLTLHCSAQATYRPRSRRDVVVQVGTRALERIAVRASARTLVLTERVSERLGPGCEVHPDVVAASAPASPRTPGPPVVVYAGRVSAEKGWRTLVELAVALPDACVRVLGDGPELASLRRLAHERGLGDRMAFAGAVPADQVPAELAAADAVVLPSEHEELGSVLIEAMAAGVPAVAYAVGGVPEAIVDGETGLLVAPGDAAALADAVRRALSDEALRGRARQAGPRRARERHDATAASQRLAALYADVARR